MEAHQIELEPGTDMLLAITCGGVYGIASTGGGTLAGKLTGLRGGVQVTGLRPARVELLNWIDGHLLTIREPKLDDIHAKSSVSIAWPDDGQDMSTAISSTILAVARGVVVDASTPGDKVTYAIADDTAYRIEEGLATPLYEDCLTGIPLAAHRIDEKCRLFVEVENEGHIAPLHLDDVAERSPGHAVRLAEIQETLTHYGLGFDTVLQVGHELWPRVEGVDAADLPALRRILAVSWEQVCEDCGGDGGRALSFDDAGLKTVICRACIVGAGLNPAIWEQARFEHLADWIEARVDDADVMAGWLPLAVKACEQIFRKCRDAKINRVESLRGELHITWSSDNATSYQRERIAHLIKKVAEYAQRVCEGCSTRSDTVAHREIHRFAAVLCDACAIYFALHLPEWEVAE